MPEGKEIKIGQGIFDRPATRRILWLLLVALCALSVGAEFFIHKQPHFAAEKFFGFFAILGFVACAGLIFIAKGLGLFLKAGVDYYDRHDHK
jgi:hypothetical protein